jgi:hypothetical protein
LAGTRSAARNSALTQRRFQRLRFPGLDMNASDSFYFFLQRRHAFSFNALGQTFSLRHIDADTVPTHVNAHGYKRRLKIVNRQ